MVSKYSFFLFRIKDMCLLDIIFYVANLKNAVLESRGIIRQGPNFDHIMLQKLSFVRRIRRTNTKK